MRSRRPWSPGGLDVATRLAGKMLYERRDRYCFLVCAYRACRLLHLTATIFCAFGARRLVSRGEFSWFVSSFVAHVATDAVSASVLALADAERETPRAPTPKSDTTRRAESFAQYAFEAITYACLVIAGAAHTAHVGYVVEEDVFSSLVLGAACRSAIVNATGVRRASTSTTSTTTTTDDKRADSHASVSTSALVNEPGESVAIVGDGAEKLFRRIVRGIVDAGDVGVVVSPANEWTIPEPNVGVCSNSLVFGDAVARVDALRMARVVETLEASLASSSRFVEHVPRRTRGVAEDVDVDEFLSTACEIGLERARRARARVFVVEHPFRELDDVARRRRWMLTKLTSARRACVFTTTDICILPFCTRIVVTHGEDVVFIGHWRELVRHASTAYACLRVGVARSPAPLRRRRVRRQSSRENRARSRLAPTRRDAQFALVVFSCASVAPAMATYALERWLDGKRSRVDDSGDALLYAAVASFCVYVVTRRALATHGASAFTLALARVGYVALASACMFPKFWLAVAATAFFVALVGEGARPERATRRLERAAGERLSRATQFERRVTCGRAQIRAAGCEEMYEDIGRRVASDARASLRRLVVARALSRAWVGGVFLTAFIFGASSLDAREDAARRGFLAFLALQTGDAMADVVERACHRRRGGETTKSTVVLGRPRAPRRARSFA